MSRRTSRAGTIAAVALAAAACTHSDDPPRAGAPATRSEAPAGAPVSTLPAPVGLDVRAITDRHVELRWRDAPDAPPAARYEVFRGEVRVAEVVAPEASEAELGPARRYCYQVRAIAADGRRSEPSATACVRTPDLRAPSAPRSLAAVSVGPGRATLTWAPSEDDVGVVAYELLRDGKVVQRVPGTTGEARDEGAPADQLHCWAVRALDASGNASPPAGPVCASPPPAAGSPTTTARSP